MTDILRAAAKATEEASQHVINAKIAVEDFFNIGTNAAGVYMNPPAQLRDLEAARDELNKAMAIMRGTAWPSEGDYHAL